MLTIQPQSPSHPRTQTKAGTLLSRLGLTATRTQSREPEWVMAAAPVANAHPLPAPSQTDSEHRPREDASDESIKDDDSTVIGRAY